MKRRIGPACPRMLAGIVVMLLSTGCGSSGSGTPADGGRADRSSAEGQRRPDGQPPADGGGQLDRPTTDGGQPNPDSSPPRPDSGGRPHNLTNLLFIHHSVGRGILMGYSDMEHADPPPATVDMRGHVAAYNAAHGTRFALWDHGYNLSVDYGTGLTNPEGQPTGTDYAFPNTIPPDVDPPGWSEQPGGNTTPDGYQALWRSSDPAWTSTRSRVMTHEVIAFKSCYYDSRIDSDDVLEVYRARYLAMRDFFDQHREKLFVPLSPPPWNPASPEWVDDQGQPLSPAAKAAIVRRSRLFANWLKSTSPTVEWPSGAVEGFLAGDHPNLVVFDLFDELAGQDNFLRPEYQFNPPGGAPDSHPNSAANNHLAEVLSRFLVEAASRY